MVGVVWGVFWVYVSGFGLYYFLFVCEGSFWLEDWLFLVDVGEDG